MVADTYSTDGIGVILMGTGNDNNTWGTNCNSSVFQIIMDALANVLTSAVTGGTLNLSGSPPPAGASQTRYAALKFTGILSSNQLVQVPNLNKWWLVCNATSGAFTLKFKTTSGSASTAIPQNSGWQMVRCDGSDVIEVWPFNTNQVQMPNGTAALPSHSFLNDTTSGLYLIGAGNIGLSLANSKVGDFGPSGHFFTGAGGFTGNFSVNTNKFTVDATTGAAVFAAGITVNGGSTFQSSSFFTIDSYRTSVGAAADFVGGVNFYGKDAAGNQTTYADILCQIVTATNGVEDGQMYFNAMVAGTLAQKMVVGVGPVFFTEGILSNGNIATPSLTASGAVSGGSAAGSMIASAGEQNTGTSTTKLVTPGRQAAHPSAVKAFGFFTVSGGVVTFDASKCYNISNVVRNTTGTYTISFTTAMSTSDYTVVATGDGAVPFSTGIFNGKTTTSFTFRWADPGSIASLRDVSIMHFSVFNLT